MLVSEIMSTNLATVTEDDSLSKAFQVLYERGHKVLPVVRGVELCGLLSERLLAEMQPSKATSLSVYEINYLMSRTKVKDIMRKDVYTVSPESAVEEAAHIMYTNNIGSLPVVDKDNSLVGIVTQTDIFKLLVILLGANREGTRIALDVPDGAGVVANITRILADADININSIGSYGTGGERHAIVLKLETSEPGDIPKKLEDAGYRVTSIQLN